MSSEAPKSTTITDVARRAGVSQATVSRVLNKKHTGSADIRSRVGRAVEELAYRPSMSAHRLARRRTDDTQGVRFVMHPAQELGNYHGDILRGVAAEAASSRYTVYFSTDNHNVGILGAGAPPTDSVGRDARGVIYAGDISHGFYAEVRSNGTPLVVINGELADMDVDCVLCDNFRASRKAVGRLTELGHRRIGCISCAGGRNSSIAERLLGYRQGLRDAGIAFDPDLVVEAGFSVPEGQAATEVLLGLPSPPTAVFGTADEVAVGALQGVRECGLQCPRDVSIVGVNDLPMAKACRPALTTVRIFREEMGRTAVQRLISLMRNPRQRPQRIDVICEFVERESCARAPGA